MSEERFRGGGEEKRNESKKERSERQEEYGAERLELQGNLRALCAACKSVCVYEPAVYQRAVNSVGF